MGAADPETYPLRKKRHTDEFLRSIAHLRPRPNKYEALSRIRSESAFAVHAFFRDRGFYYLHTPITTGSDCEGAGALFRVTTLPPVVKESGQSADVYADDFFGNVYTFGPTFRAEDSNAPRHAAEFWMIEPEMAFADLDDNMDLAEAFVKHLVVHVMEHCAEDLELFARFVDQDLRRDLEVIIKAAYVRLPYTAALRSSNARGRRSSSPSPVGRTSRPNTSAI